MKKAMLVAIVLALACLGLVASATTPATAKKACASARWTDAAVDREYHQGNWVTLTTAVRYKPCNSGQYAKILQLNITIDPEPEGVSCGNNGILNKINYWRINPDKLGSWNPGIRTLDCKPKMTQTWVYSAPEGLTVYRGNPANQRCVGGYVTGVFSGTWDDTEDLRKVCVV